MSLLLHTVRVPTTATASTAAANYAATQALTPQVARSWRSTTTGASYLQLDLGASLAVAGVSLTGCNFASCSVLADNAATPVTSRGTLVLAADRQGRVKGSLTFAATVRYIRFSIASGTPLNGAAYWEVGSAQSYAGNLTLPADPLYGGSRIDWHTPQQRADLPNGTTETWETGSSLAELALGFRGSETDDIEALKRHARAGLVWFDFGVASDRGLQFPVRHRDPSVSSRFEGFNRRSIEVVLREEA